MPFLAMCWVIGSARRVRLVCSGSESCLSVLIWSVSSGGGPAVECGGIGAGTHTAQLLNEFWRRRRIGSAHLPSVSSSATSWHREMVLRRRTIRRKIGRSCGRYPYDPVPVCLAQRLPGLFLCGITTL